MSNDFTIEDIHVLRYENYEDTKELSDVELIERTREKASNGWKRIEQIRKEKELVTR